ncbi:MAG: hypothetical protein HC898_13320 [Phycisphaerales bacterium]|nr:hypothetical protein [Phycisphaerales bacterium]
MPRWAMCWMRLIVTTCGRTRCWWSGRTTGLCWGNIGAGAKNWMPMYEEVAHTPFFVWDPRFKKAGERRESLVQPAIDLGPTLLRYFGVEPTKDMRGHDLAPVVEKDAKVRDAAIFGYFGQGVNVTDGRYTYLGSRYQGRAMPDTR